MCYWAAYYRHGTFLAEQKQFKANLRVHIVTHTKLRMHTCHLFTKLNGNRWPSFGEILLTHKPINREENTSHDGACFSRTHM